MSYILGALKKAEKDRRRDRGLDINHWDQESWDQPGQTGSQANVLLWVVSLALIIVIVIFGWLAYRIVGAGTQLDLGNSGSSYEVSEPSQDKFAVSQMDNLSQPKEYEPVLASEDALSSEETNEEQVSEQSDGTDISVSKSELPEFSGHIYFPGNANLSRIFSGTQAFREGDTVSGYRISQILENEVVLEFEGEELSVNLDN